MAETVRVRARFESYENLEHALKRLKEKDVRRYEAYGPIILKNLEEHMPKEGSPVRIWSTAGALLGLFGFWYLCVAAALIYNLVVGGKLPVSNVPYVVVMYEGTILLGAIFAFLAGLVLFKVWRIHPPAGYDPRYTNDSFGVEIECDRDEEGQIIEMLKESGVTEIYEH
ncbi:MAG: DUF3341 domain-containing protein [Armatimonadetes bacterium]|nr:DUF3341 domain-containing protein [Armatimonadota bacterium]